MKNKTNHLSSAIFTFFLLLLPADSIDAATRAALLEILPALVGLVDKGDRPRRDKQRRSKGG